MSLPDTAAARKPAAGPIAPVPDAKPRRPRPPHAAPPFTKENAAEMARRSAAVRAEKKIARDRSIAQLNELVGEKLAALPAKEKIGELAQVIVVDTLLHLAAKKPKDRSTNENLAILKVAWAIKQVDEGSPTSITWSEEYAKGRLADLREKLEERRGMGFPAAVPDAAS